MPQQKKKGKRSSKIHVVPSRPRRVRIPADQKALGRYGYRCIWTSTGYKAVPMGSNAR